MGLVDFGGMGPDLRTERLSIMMEFIHGERGGGGQRGNEGLNGVEYFQNSTSNKYGTESLLIRLAH